MRVLLIDDKPSREVWTHALAARGAEVRAVSDASSAWRTALEFSPSVVVCDLSLTTIDGPTFIREVRAVRPLHGVLGIAIVEATSGASSEGFDVALVRPVETMALVRAALTRRHA